MITFCYHGKISIAMVCWMQGVHKPSIFIEIVFLWRCPFAPWLIQLFTCDVLNMSQIPGCNHRWSYWPKYPGRPMETSQDDLKCGVFFLKQGFPIHPFRGRLKHYLRVLKKTWKSTFSISCQIHLESTVKLSLPWQQRVWAVNVCIAYTSLLTNKFGTSCQTTVSFLSFSSLCQSCCG